MAISSPNMTEEEFLQLQKALSRWDNEGGAHLDEVQSDIPESTNPDIKDPVQRLRHSMISRASSNIPSNRKGIINRRFSALLAAVLMPSIVFAAEPQSQPVTASLSPETRVVIIGEMQAISQAMGRIHTAVVTGDHSTVAEEARNIHDSFVLEQELSDSQREEIGTELPTGFIEADQAFHVLSERLAQAGESSNPTLERLWFQEMTRACQACHTDYAGARFPGLMPDGSTATE